MDDTPSVTEALRALRATSKTFKATKEEHRTSIKKTHEAILVALRAGAIPSVVTRDSPYTSARIRQIAREAGIEPSEHRGPNPGGGDVRDR